MPPAVRQQQRVAHLPELQALEIARRQRLQRGGGGRVVRTGEEALAHMRDVEQAGVLARPAVLGEDALVLDRHGIAGEGHHARAELDVQIVEGGAAERFRFRRPSVLDRTLHEEQA